MPAIDTDFSLYPSCSQNYAVDLQEECWETLLPTILNGCTLGDGPATRSDTVDKGPSILNWQQKIRRNHPPLLLKIALLARCDLSHLLSDVSWSTHASVGSDNLPVVKTSPVPFSTDSSSRKFCIKKITTDYTQITTDYSNYHRAKREGLILGTEEVYQTPLPSAWRGNRSCGLPTIPEDPRGYIPNYSGPNKSSLQKVHKRQNLDPNCLSFQQPIIGSFRLPTHSRDAHRKFFLMIPSYFKIKILAIQDEFVLLGHKGLICRVQTSGQYFTFAT